MFINVFSMLWVLEVACSEKVNSFYFCPLFQVWNAEGRGAGSCVLGVNVKIGD
jgi:hypothetical protein